MAADDRACPICNDQLHLVQLGAESADRWQLIHRVQPDLCLVDHDRPNRLDLDWGAVDHCPQQRPQQTAVRE